MQFINSFTGNDLGSDIISETLTYLYSLLTEARDVQDGILQTAGIGSEWERAEATCKEIRRVISFLEEILCYAISDDIDGLVTAHDTGDLLYMQI